MSLLSRGLLPVRVCGEEGACLGDRYPPHGVLWREEREGAEAEKGKVGPVRGSLALLSPTPEACPSRLIRDTSLLTTCSSLSQLRASVHVVPLPGELPVILHEVVSESAEQGSSRPVLLETMDPAGPRSPSHPQKQTQSRCCPRGVGDQAPQDLDPLERLEQSHKISSAFGEDDCHSVCVGVGEIGGG